jgi:hypothetical protein
VHSVGENIRNRRKSAFPLYPRLCRAGIGALSKSPLKHPAQVIALPDGGKFEQTRESLIQSFESP